MKPYPLTGPIFFAKIELIPPDDMTAIELAEFTQKEWEYLRQRLVSGNCPECGANVWGKHPECVLCGWNMPPVSDAHEGKSPLEDLLNED